MSQSKRTVAPKGPSMNLDRKELKNRKVRSVEDHLGRLVSRDKQKRKAYFQKAFRNQLLLVAGQNFKFEAKKGKASAFSALQSMMTKGLGRDAKISQKKINQFVYACLYKLTQAGIQINYFHPGETISFGTQNNIILKLRRNEKSKNADLTLNLKLTQPKKELLKAVRSARLESSRQGRNDLEKKLAADNKNDVIKAKLKLIQNSKTLYGAMYYMGLGGKNFYRNMENLYNKLRSSGKMPRFKQVKFNKYSGKIVRAMHQAILKHYAKLAPKNPKPKARPAPSIAKKTAPKAKTMPKKALKQKKAPEKITTQHSLVKKSYQKYFNVNNGIATLKQGIKSGLKQIVPKKVSTIMYKPNGSNKWIELTRHTNGHFLVPQDMPKKFNDGQNRALSFGVRGVKRVAIYKGDAIKVSPSNGTTDIAPAARTKSKKLKNTLTKTLNNTQQKALQAAIKLMTQGVKINQSPAKLKLKKQIKLPKLNAEQRAAVLRELRKKFGSQLVNKTIVLKPVEIKGRTHQLIDQLKNNKGDTTLAKKLVKHLRNLDTTNKETFSTKVLPILTSLEGHLNFYHRFVSDGVMQMLKNADKTAGEEIRKVLDARIQNQYGQKIKYLTKMTRIYNGQQALLLAKANLNGWIQKNSKFPSPVGEYELPYTVE